MGSVWGACGGACVRARSGVRACSLSRVVCGGLPSRCSTQTHSFDRLVYRFISLFGSRALFLGCLAGALVIGCFIAAAAAASKRLSNTRQAQHRFAALCAAHPLTLLACHPALL